VAVAVQLEPVRALLVLLVELVGQVQLTPLPVRLLFMRLAVAVLELLPAARLVELVQVQVRARLVLVETLRQIRDLVAVGQMELLPVTLAVLAVQVMS
jgi:hypothetical protein